MPLKLGWSTRIWQHRLHTRHMGGRNSAKGRYEVTHTSLLWASPVLQTLSLSFLLFPLFFVTPSQTLCYKHSIGLHKSLNKCIAELRQSVTSSCLYMYVNIFKVCPKCNRTGVTNNLFQFQTTNYMVLPQTNPSQVWCTFPSFFAMLLCTAWRILPGWFSALSLQPSW